MFNGIVYQFLLKAILFALLGLILYGVVPDLALILVIFVLWRFTSLLVEALRKPVTTAQWDARLAALARILETFTPEQRSRRAAALKFDPRLSARELAQAQIDRAIRSYQPPRPKLELAAEALGVVTFTILIPLDVALYTSDVFSLHATQRWGWAGATVTALCVALYLWPYHGFKSPDSSDLRILWWVLPFALALPLGLHAVQSRHPYLNPFNPDRDRLAAERVLSLKNNIIAGQYADWVLRYARKLDQRGETQQAVHFYREGLRLDANNREAHARLAILEAQMSGGTAENVAEPARSTSVPYWTADKPVTKSPRRRIDSQLENVEGCTVVIVPVGEVSGDLLDTVAYVIHNELDLPVYISPDPVPLPPHSRVRGLATGPQWDFPSHFHAFTNATPIFPKAPIKYLMVTPGDIYMEDVNYAFSCSSEWVCLLSFARFGGPNGNDPLLRQRTAKQALCALIKSFNIPASPDRNCVTSYVRSLEEFDAKGDRPDADTLKQFRQAVYHLNLGWQNYQAKRPAAN